MAKQIRPYGYWTDERVIEESKKYKTKMEFKQNSSTAYKTACQRKLIDGMTWLKTDRHKKRGPRKVHKYTKKVILSFIQEHNCVTFAEFRKLNEYAYNQAKKNGWFVELGLIRNKHEDGYWTKETVFKIARDYNNKSDFQKNEPTAYKWASEYNLLDKMDWMTPPNFEEIKDKKIYVVYVYEDVENKVAYVGLTKDNNSRKRSHKYDKSVGAYFGSEIPEPIILKERLTVTESQYFEDYFKKQYRKNGYELLNVAPTGVNIGSIGGIVKWTKDSVFEESKKYASKSEFQREAGGAYNCAKHNKWLDEMKWLTTPVRNIKWTHEAVIEESHKYEYKCDFRNNSSGAHQVASEKGWLSEMTWLKDKKKVHPTFRVIDCR